MFGIDRMWDAVRPLDNKVSAAVQVELRTEATRLAERTARWLLRLPAVVSDPPAPIGEVTDRFATAIEAVRAGLPGWLLGAEATAYAERAARLETAGVPAQLAADAAAAPLMPAALDLAVVAEQTGAPIALAGHVMQCLAERLGLVPLRELVIALPRDRRWPSMARATLRDDLAAEQAALTADVLDAAPQGRRPGAGPHRGLGLDVGRRAAAGRRAADRHHVGRPPGARRAAGRRPDAARPAPPRLTARSPPIRPPTAQARKQAAPAAVVQFAAARSSIVPVDGTTKPAIAEMPKRMHPARLTAGCHQPSVPRAGSSPWRTDAR